MFIIQFTTLNSELKILFRSLLHRVIRLVTAHMDTMRMFLTMCQKRLQPHAPKKTGTALTVARSLGLHTAEEDIGAPAPAEDQRLSENSVNNEKKSLHGPRDKWVRLGEAHGACMELRRKRVHGWTCDLSKPGSHGNPQRSFFCCSQGSKTELSEGQG